MAFKLDRLGAFFQLVKPGGTASSAFVALWEKMCGKIEAQEASQDTSLAAAIAQQAQIIAALGSISAASAIAVSAQQSADGSSQAKSATDTGAVDLTDLSWVPVAQVNLTGVVAGDLTISGSGPIQSDGVEVSGPGKVRIAHGAFRIVEIVGATETVLYTGDLSVTGLNIDDDLGAVSTTSSQEVAAFSSAQASTGAVSYRLDFRLTSTANIVSNIAGYLFARRDNATAGSFALQSTILTAGTGLTGGGNLSADRTFGLANTAVTPGTYGSASKTVSFTVDAQGRLTAAAEHSLTSSGWTSPTGTAQRSGFATYTAPTISAAYVQAEVQAIATAGQATSRTLKALIDDLTTRGLLST